MRIFRFKLRLGWKSISNARYKTKKAYSRMIILRMLKALDAPRHVLLKILQKQLWIVLTLGVPAWHCLLTEQERQTIQGLLDQIQTTHLLTDGILQEINSTTLLTVIVSDQCY